MRYFLSRRIPPADAILLIESGSRSILEQVVPGIRQTWGEDVAIDLVTCYARLPEGLPENARVYRTTEYRGRDGRKRLYREIASTRYALVGMICSGEPILIKWKWAIAWQLRSKLFLINENGDFFWADYSNWRIILHFFLFRAGLTGAEAVPTLTRLAMFPFTLLFLLTYAGWVHLKRATRS